MKSGTGKIVILISADEEWKIVKQIVNPHAALTSSPFGEWYLHDFEI
jgi:hypothetical protein